MAILNVRTDTTVHIWHYPPKNSKGEDSNCGENVTSYVVVAVRYRVRFTNDPVGRRPKNYSIGAEARVEIHWSCKREWFIIVPYCDYVEGARTAISADVEDGGMSAGVKIGVSQPRRTRPHCRQFKVGWVAWRNHGPVDASIVGGVDSITVPVLGEVQFPFKLDGVLGVASPGETTFTTCCEECERGCCKATADTAEVAASSWTQED